MMIYPSSNIPATTASVPTLASNIRYYHEDLALATQSTAILSSGQLGISTISSGSDNILKMIDTALRLELSPTFWKIQTPWPESEARVHDDSDHTPTKQVASAIAKLERYAQDQDRDGFAAVIEHIAWEYLSADMMTHAIDLALSLDLPKHAAEAARVGLGQYPDDPRIRQAARVLEPPIVRRMPSPQSGGLSASQAWLRDHATSYRGQWVVVRAGHLLGAATDLGTLRTLIEHENDPATTIITKVW